MLTIRESGDPALVVGVFSAKPFGDGCRLRRIHETPKPRLCETRDLFAPDVGPALHFDPLVD